MKNATFLKLQKFVELCIRHRVAVTVARLAAPMPRIPV